MPNKDVTTLLRKARKQGAELRTRNGGVIEVHGPRGMYLVHTGLSAGAHLGITKKALRKIGLDV